jgi:hypothetical protein
LQSSSYRTFLYIVNCPSLRKRDQMKDNIVENKGLGNKI